MPVSEERELTRPVRLCAPDGTLDRAAVGWARQPLIDCTLFGSWGRRKRWDFWSVVGRGFAMNLTYADVDYVGLIDVWFHDFDTDQTATLSVPVPLARGMHLPARAGDGDMGRRTKKFGFSYTEEPEGTALRSSFETETGPFVADVLAHRPGGHESLTVVIPWSAQRFQCTTKDVARPATGTIRWGDREYLLDGPGESWACLDFGRGKWPYRTRWNWGAGAGVVDGRTVGVQVGGKWTDGTGMTENSLYVEGRLSKISEELVWEYDTGNWLRPWRIHAPLTERVDLTFTPIYDKVTRLSAGFAASTVDQCFGHWSGTIVPDDGDSIEIRELFGWAEEATWRW